MRDLSDMTIGNKGHENQILRKVRIKPVDPDEPIIGEFMKLPSAINVYDAEEDKWMQAEIREYQNKNSDIHFLLGTLKNLNKSVSNDKIVYTGKAKNYQSDEEINTYLDMDKGKILTDNGKYQGLPILKRHGKTGSPEELGTELIYGGNPKNESALKEINEKNNLVYTEINDFLDNYSPLF